jgi:hypothetical protein
VSDVLNVIEDMTINLLSSMDKEEITRDVIVQATKNISPLVASMYGARLTENEINHVVRRLETRFDISMELGTLLFTKDYKPWLVERKPTIDWYYWQRYRRFLSNSGLAAEVVRVTDIITDQVLDHLEDPQKSGAWKRKGMVVGHVQSGKTANFIAIINKAADSGYRVIILLAGLLNSLRNQTQDRIDSGFIGRDTSLKIPVGVGELDRDRTPIYFTTNTGDFKKSVANQIGVGIADLKEPVILVVKKNKSTLTNLIEWLHFNNRHKLRDNSMLLIDDEADNASINTNKEGADATAINQKIRELLNLFDRSSYVGYTATPFANVFIDPDSDNEMLGADLFPRDFIINLDPPSNYVGPNRIFSSDADLTIIREVTDYETHLPLQHKMGWQPQALPESLKRAIQVFVLVKAMRLLRGHKGQHNSMMVNVSRFTAVQSRITGLINEYVTELREGITNHYGLSVQESLRSSVMTELYQTWQGEFPTSQILWLDIQNQLKEAVSIGVIEVNSSFNSSPLDYSKRNYPSGRNVIAVGGMGLSRGLTLEGLTVSYFLRNSVMYDTLMQMGRWFGYRDGYEDLCRLYMTPEAASWYAHISEATDELRDEFRRMKSAGMSPADFGLRVRSHPESLIVTAKNKMRTATTVLREIDLEGRLAETSVLYKSTNVTERNFAVLQEIIKGAQCSGKFEDHKLGYLWKHVNDDYILAFIESFQNHPASQLTDKNPLMDYISYLQKPWDVILVKVTERGQSPLRVKVEGIDEYLIPQYRDKVTDIGANGIALNKRRVASRGLERAGLAEAEQKSIAAKYQGQNIPDHEYRTVRKRPLLMLHILDAHYENDKVPLFPNGLPAYGISFPGTPGTGKRSKLVKYEVNTIWWRNEYADTVEDDEFHDE